MAMGLAYAAHQWPQRSSLQVGLRVGGHLVPTHIDSSNPSELSQWLCHRWYGSTIHIARDITVFVSLQILSSCRCYLARVRIQFAVFVSISATYKRPPLRLTPINSSLTQVTTLCSVREFAAHISYGMQCEPIGLTEQKCFRQRRNCSGNLVKRWRQRVPADRPRSSENAGCSSIG